AMTRQIDQMQAKTRRERTSERCEDARMHRPAVQHDEIGTYALNIDVHSALRRADVFEVLRRARFAECREQPFDISLGMQGRQRDAQTRLALWNRRRTNRGNVETIRLEPRGYFERRRARTDDDRLDRRARIHQCEAALRC